MKIATLYHATIPLATGGIPTYLNGLFNYGKQFDFKVKHFGFQKYRDNKEIMNQEQLIEPIIVYNNSKELVDILNTYDIVIMYYPPIMYKNEKEKESTYEFVTNIWQQLNTKKVLQMHLANYGNKIMYDQHPFITSIMNSCDIVMTRSSQNPIAKYCINQEKPWFQLKLFYDFNQFETVPKQERIVAIGRSERWKKLHLLKYGKEYLEQFMEVMHAKRIPHSIALELMATSMICFCPTKNKQKHEYSNQLEYVQMEALANNCVLVLNKHQGENCYYKGTRWIDIPNFALWFDEKDLDWTWKQIANCITNKEYEKYTIAKEIFKEELAIENFKKQMLEIKNI